MARLAAAGTRVLAVATRTIDHQPRTVDEAERDLTLLGLIGFADPPRPEAGPAVAACHRAGIAVVMVTGDHPATAATIGAQVGFDGQHPQAGAEIDALAPNELVDLLRIRPVVARATPEHKHRIVTALQAAGEVVAVTGDGINDAPALAAADIGVAMGRRGTDIARDAADVVLADDNFATLEAGVEEGRLLRANLHKAIRFYLAAKVALIAIVLVAALAGLPQPFAPVQIIVMELFMDLAASAAFVAERPEHDLMAQRPADPRGRFLDSKLIASIFVAGASLFAGVTGAYLGTRWLGHTDQAGTVAFVTWQLGHVALAFHLRSEREPLTRLGIATNRVMVAWAVAAALFVAAVVTDPALRSVFRTTTLSASSWMAVLAGGLLTTAWIELAKHRRATRAVAPVAYGGGHDGAAS